MDYESAELYEPYHFEFAEDVAKRYTKEFFIWFKSQDMTIRRAMDITNLLKMFDNG